MKASDYKLLPETPGVYLMKDVTGKILYVGKAGNLRRRVSSYFERPHDVRIQTLVSRIATIDHRDTDTAIEALILCLESDRTDTIDKIAKAKRRRRHIKHIKQRST